MTTTLKLLSILVVLCLLNNCTKTKTINQSIKTTPEVVIHLNSAGSLPEFIAQSKKYKIENLTLKGDLNGTDIKYIREMASQGRLSVLNIADANIKSGGDPYNIIPGDFIEDPITRQLFVKRKEKSLYVEDNTIGVIMFDECSSLSKISIPKTVTVICGRSFFKCRNLRSIEISERVVDIDGSAFSGCSRLEKILVSENNKYYSTIDDILFNKNKTKIICYPNAKSSTYVIPNSVLEIGESAFEKCKNLTKLTLPSNIYRIESRAFSDCDNLLELHVKNPIPISIGKYTFSVFNEKKCTLFVPKGSYNMYWTAPIWGDLENIVEE